MPSAVQPGPLAHDMPDSVAETHMRRLRAGWVDACRAEHEKHWRGHYSLDATLADLGASRARFMADLMLLAEIGAGKLEAQDCGHARLLVEHFMDWLHARDEAAWEIVAHWVPEDDRGTPEEEAEYREMNDPAKMMWEDFTFVGDMLRLD